LDLSYYNRSDRVEHEIYLLDKLNVQIDKKYNELTLIDSKNKLLSLIGRIYRFCYFGKNIKYVGVWNPQEYRDLNLSEYQNIYLEGWFQSYKYFQDYSSDIKRFFSPNFEFGEETARWIDNVSKNDSIAVHIRRGDYLTYFGASIDLNYYIQSIDIINKKISNGMLYVFSDDINWAKENLKYKNIIFVSSGKMSMLEEFFIMKSCKNQIISNSSFSWWAAWLNDNVDKIVIAPVVKSDAGNWSEDNYPESWITIQTEMR